MELKSQKNPAYPSVPTRDEYESKQVFDRLQRWWKGLITVVRSSHSNTYDDLTNLSVELANLANSSNLANLTTQVANLSNTCNTLSNQVASVSRIGTIRITFDSTNPGTYLGGTWTQIGQGLLLVGQDANNANFANSGTVANTSWSHLHAVDPPEANTGASLGNGPRGDPGTLEVAKDTHYHTVNIASFNSANTAILPPTYVVYIWRRTA